MPHLDAGRLIYLDETAASTAETRRYARAAPGERAVGDVPCGHWSVITLVAALGVQGVLASLIYSGGTDIEAFAAFVEEVLAPKLRSGDIVLLDNLSSHKSERVRLALAARGATLLLLPPYSPDLNPIEKAWAKLKSWLRTRAARTTLTVGYALGEALDRITAADCRGYFASCGVSLATLTC